MIFSENDLNKVVNYIFESEVKNIIDPIDKDVLAYLIYETRKNHNGQINAKNWDRYKCKQRYKRMSRR